MIFGIFRNLTVTIHNSEYGVLIIQRFASQSVWSASLQKWPQTNFPICFWNRHLMTLNISQADKASCVPHKCALNLIYLASPCLEAFSFCLLDYSSSRCLFCAMCWRGDREMDYRDRGYALHTVPPFGGVKVVLEWWGPQTQDMKWGCVCLHLRERANSLDKNKDGAIWMLLLNVKLMAQFYICL